MLAGPEQPRVVFGLPRQLDRRCLQTPQFVALGVRSLALFFGYAVTLWPSVVAMDPPPRLAATSLTGNHAQPPA